MRKYSRSKIKLIFVGCGKQARNITLCVHKNRDVLDELDFIGFDPSKESRTLFQRYTKDLFPTSQVHIHNCIDDLCESLDDSVVFICSPPSCHLENFRNIKNKRYRNVVLEKPLANSKSDIEEIAKLVKSSTMSFLVQEQYLHSILIEELVNLVKNPSMYVEKCLIEKVPSLSIEETVSFFSKNRIQDLELKRHVEHVCFIELPHVVSVLLFVFKNLRAEMFKGNDFLWNGEEIHGYKDGKCVFMTDGKIKHTVYLSNIDKFRRDIVVKLSNGFEVIFTFPGQLSGSDTKFISSVSITKLGEIVYLKKYKDDHLRESIRRILCSHNHRGTLDLSVQVSNLITDLIHG